MLILNELLLDLENSFNPLIGGCWRKECFTRNLASTSANQRKERGFMEEILKNIDKIESVQAILEEAGLIHRQTVENPEIRDGKVIILADAPLADRNYNDIVDFEDVVVLANGESVEVANIDEENGRVVLSKKLGESAEVRVLYSYSSVNRSLVERVRNEVVAELKMILNAGFVERNLDAVRYGVRLYAAGKLQIRDYGFNQDFENGSKDGYAKIKLAKAEFVRLAKLQDDEDLNGDFEIVEGVDLFEKRGRCR